MIHSQPRLGLPLVHHLMQQGVLDLGPRVPIEVSPAHTDFFCPASHKVHRELAQAALHPAGDPNRDLAQDSAEMLGVQLAMQLLQSMEQPQVSRTSSFPTNRPVRGRSIGLNREVEKLPLRGASERSGNPRIQKPNHSLQHAIGRERVAPVDPENPPAQAQHHCLICVGEDSVHVPETKYDEPLRKTILKQKTLPSCHTYPLPRCRLPRFPASQLPHLHSP
jgi:hypothetical protein